jgi:hypothetical protein
MYILSEKYAFYPYKMKKVPFENGRIRRKRRTGLSGKGVGGVGALHGHHPPQKVHPLRRDPEALSSAFASAIADPEGRPQ